MAKKEKKLKTEKIPKQKKQKKQKQQVPLVPEHQRPLICPPDRAGRGAFWVTYAVALWSCAFAGH